MYKRQVQVTLTSDAYSQGSGLASSSSYTISLIKACCLFFNLSITNNDVCKLAYQLERIYNPYCGYQDPYGCGMGGFKRIDFLGGSSVRYQFLSCTIFDDFDIHLVFSGVTRNSRRILQKVTQNLEKVRPLLETADEAYEAIMNEDHKKFLHLVDKSWSQKKATTSSIIENDIIREMDDILAYNDTVCAHRLCGAGNGGFFLTFSKKGTLNIPYKSVKISIEPDGVYGESI